MNTGNRGFVWTFKFGEVWQISMMRRHVTNRQLKGHRLTSWLNTKNTNFRGSALLWETGEDFEFSIIYYNLYY